MLTANYQPKLNINTGKVDKLEALIRWVNNEGNFVNPELFVDLAEKAGLIVSLTRWVIVAVITIIIVIIVVATTSIITCTIQKLNIACSKV